MNGVNARGIRNPGARVGRVNEGRKTRVKAGAAKGEKTGETLNPGIREMAVNKNFTANMSAG